MLRMLAPLEEELTASEAAAMTPQSVAMIIKACAAALGLEPGHFAGHSLRRGLLKAAGRSLFKMAQHSRHRSLETVREYVEDAGKFDDHANKGLLAASGGEQSR